MGYKSLTAPLFVLAVLSNINSAEPLNQPSSTPTITKTVSSPTVSSPTALPAFTPFTGKITRNKVRLRLQPSGDAPILRQMDQGDLVIVLEETDDFYAIQPPAGTKGYVFRTFVLDNVIEGNKVNVRLEPNTDASVIAQLNSGDRVDGIVSASNIGDRNLMAALEKRKQEVNRLLSSAQNKAEEELGKPFNEIQMDAVFANLNLIIRDYNDFPEQVKLAKKNLASAQESYLKKKIAYLESKATPLSSTSEEANEKPQENHLEEIIAHYEEKPLETPVATSEPLVITTNIPEPSIIVVPESNPQPISSGHSNENHVSEKQSIWGSAEEKAYQEWAKSYPNYSQDEFYQAELQAAVHLKGIVEPYHRAVKNKPGDFVLVRITDRKPIAYLYSTKCDLQALSGQEVSVKASPRPNNNFAFPAYFVLSID
jgi:uncharacterized protein YgiM (DUF1202 family)